MPHAAIDSVSRASQLGSGTPDFVLSFSNLFDQYKAICRSRMRCMDAAAQGLTRGGN